MKNYISKATLALLVALSATGCSDFLDEKLKSEHPLIATVATGIPDGICTIE